MTNFDYKQIHEDFIKTAKEIREENVKLGLGMDLLEAASQALSLQIEKEAKKLSTPGYYLFAEQEEITEETEIEEKVSKTKKAKKPAKKAETQEAEVANLDQEVQVEEDATEEVVEALVEQTPADEVVEEAPIQETFVEEAPVEEAAAEVTEEVAEEAPVEEAVAEVTEETPADEVVDENEELVYSSKTGTKYHKPYCMYRKKTFEETTLAQAKEAGKEACTTCFTE